MEYVLSNAPLIIGATGMDSIMQNIRMIIMATEYSVPLDRGFAHVGEAVDTPSPRITALYVARLIDAIEANEPRVKVTSIRLASPEGAIQEAPAASEGATSGMDGRLTPIVTFRLKDGITL